MCAPVLAPSVVAYQFTAEIPRTKGSAGSGALLHVYVDVGLSRGAADCERGESSRRTPARLMRSDQVEGGCNPATSIAVASPPWALVGCAGVLSSSASVGPRRTLC